MKKFSLALLYVSLVVLAFAAELGQSSAYAIDESVGAVGADSINLKDTSPSQSSEGPSTDTSIPQSGASKSTQSPATSPSSQNPGSSETSQYPDTSASTQNPATSDTTDSPGTSASTQNPGTSDTTDTPATSQSTPNPSTDGPSTTVSSTTTEEPPTNDTTSTEAPSTETSASSTEPPESPTTSGPPVTTTHAPKPPPEAVHISVTFTGPFNKKEFEDKMSAWFTKFCSKSAANCGSSRSYKTAYRYTAEQKYTVTVYDIKPKSQTEADIHFTVSTPTGSPIPKASVANIVETNKDDIKAETKFGVTVIPDTTPGGGLGAGTIVAIVIGVIILLVILGLVVMLFRDRRESRTYVHGGRGHGSTHLRRSYDNANYDATGETVKIGQK